MFFGFCLYLNLNAQLASTCYMHTFSSPHTAPKHRWQVPQHYRHHLATCCKFGNRKVVKLKLQKLSADIASLANVLNVGLE